MVEAAPNKVIVVSAAGTELGVQLRNQDMSWNEFLSTVHDLPRYYCMFFLQITLCVCVFPVKGISVLTGLKIFHQLINLWIL